MLLVDIVLLVLLLTFVMNGWKDGIIQTLGRLIGAVIGFVAARAWSPLLGGVISFFLPNHAGIAQLIAFIIVFLLIDRLIGWVFGIAASFFRLLTRLPLLATVDSLIGAVFGFAEGVVMIGSSIYLVLTLRLDPTLVDWLTRSSVAHYMETVFHRVLGFLL